MCPAGCPALSSATCDTLIRAIHRPRARPSGAWTGVFCWRAGIGENLGRKKQIKGSGQGCPLYTGLGENALALHWKYRMCRVLRLRSCFASRSGYSAQDDISPERWAQPPLYIRLLLRFSSSGDGFAGFLVGGEAVLGFALVPHLFALGAL